MPTTASTITHELGSETVEQIYLDYDASDGDYTVKAIDANAG